MPPRIHVPPAAILSEAADVATSPARLATLAKMAKWPEAAAAAQRNPSLPSDTLRELLQEGKGHAWCNPCVTLLLLEAPGATWFTQGLGALARAGDDALGPSPTQVKEGALPWLQQWWSVATGEQLLWVMAGQARQKGGQRFGLHHRRLGHACLAAIDAVEAATTPLPELVSWRPRLQAILHTGRDDATLGAEVKVAVAMAVAAKYRHEQGDPGCTAAAVAALAQAVATAVVVLETEPFYAEHNVSSLTEALGRAYANHRGAVAIGAPGILPPFSVTQREATTVVAPAIRTLLPTFVW